MILHNSAQIFHEVNLSIHSCLNIVVDRSDMYIDRSTWKQYTHVRFIPLKAAYKRVAAQYKK